MKCVKTVLFVKEGFAIFERNKLVVACQTGNDTGIEGDRLTENIASQIHEGKRIFEIILIAN